MLRSFSEIKGAHVHAKDGQLGSVKSLYFDDGGWKVRHFLVGAGNLLTNRDVLLSPEAVREEDKTARMLLLRSSLTSEEVKNEPGAETDPPVAVRRRSAQLATSPYPVTGESSTGPAGAPIDAGPRDASGRPTSGLVDEASETGDPRLRSTREVRGYRVRSRDGEIGHIKDFVVDTGSWTIRYVAVDTSNWLPGKKVLVASPWILGVSWEDAEVSVDLDSFEVKEAPAWNPDVPVDRAYEEKLHAHYGRTLYRALGDAYGR